MVVSKLSFSSVLRSWTVLGAMFFAAALAAPQVRAEGASLSGSWSGGGIVRYSDGHSEHARCRAQFSHSGQHVSLQALCATPSGSANQTANLRQTGPNSYSGTFFNSQFNVTGRIHISVHGNSQSVSLSSSSGSASLTLRR